MQKKKDKEEEAQQAKMESEKVCYRPTQNETL